ncbi:MAG: hypothetical protein HQL03_10240 [Nitrospirae bacterium]|nr:hypothetical protein [Nitrospirota bacterium]MBF0591606.1 hypothetical protein [Nitrospirota bacterium]
MGFEDLIRLICRFAIQHKDQETHANWLDLMLHVRGHGFEADDKLEPQMCLVRDSIRRFHDALHQVQGIDRALTGLSCPMAIFIQQTREGWGYAEWKMFLHDLRHRGIILSRETEHYLKELFESINGLYQIFAGKKN